LQITNIAMIACFLRPTNHLLAHLLGRPGRLSNWILDCHRAQTRAHSHKPFYFLFSLACEGDCFCLL